ncbi:hypothetical protein Pfo_013060 [Paulownia fortunei]|nr:hypothetical protein Pfo_013060 [Paulownia fortunei]
MASFNSKSLIIIFQLAISFFLLSGCPCYADTISFRGSLCPTPPGAENSSWTANLNSVFSSLEANVNLSNGYYKAEGGESSDKAYGLIQCRGDISPSDCGECTRESFRLATKNCGGSKSGIIWQTWCFLRYSNASFYGVWERSGFATSNVTTLDDPRVAAKGLAMMAGLAVAAPDETLMFAKSETDDGMGGKRHGVAQCSRDLGKSDCGDCLDYLLKGFGTTIAKKREWEIYGVGCFMLYGDTQFYLNTSSTSAQSPPAADGVVRPPNGANRAWAGRFAVGITILTTAMAFL